MGVRMDYYDHLNPPGVPARSRNAVWIILVLVALLALLGYTQAGDDQATADAEAYARGKLAGRLELAATVGDAYQQGLSEGLRTAASAPDGVQLAQVCMAWWYDGPLDKATLRKRVCGARS